MLKIRVMPTLLYRGSGLVKGIGFDSWRPIGAAIQAVRVFALREVDELVFLDIAATGEGRPPDVELIGEMADACRMPLAVGGGITTLDDIQRLLVAGADKVVIGTAALRDPDLVSRASARFGAQCVVVALDCRRRADGGHEVYARCGREATGRDAVAVAREMERAGAGELIATSIERDGTMTGYDLDLVRAIASAVRIPVIASGGAGDGDHCVAAVRAGAAAVAAGAMFQFTEQTPIAVKHRLVDAGIPARLEGART